MKRTLAAICLLIAGSFPPATLAQPGLEFVPIEPCRVADTRQSSEGVIDADTVRNLRVTGSAANLAAQGGEVNCPNPRPDQPVAVAAYLIAISTPDSGNGNLLAFPSGTNPDAGSTVNYKATGNIGNTSIVSLCTSGGCPTGGPLAIRSNFSEQHVVVDIKGYFYRAGHGMVTYDEPLSWQVGGGGRDVAGIEMDIPAAGIVQLNFNAIALTGPSQTASCSLKTFYGEGEPETLTNVALSQIQTPSETPLGFTRGIPVTAGAYKFTVRCQRIAGSGNFVLSKVNLTGIYTSNVIGQPEDLPFF